MMGLSNCVQEHCATVRHTSACTTDLTPLQNVMWAGGQSASARCQIQVCSYVIHVKALVHVGKYKYVVTLFM